MNKHLKVVVSLFDGAACGLQALKEAGYTVGRYYAFEIDKYAQFVAMKNHPEIKQCGSVEKFPFVIFRGADLVIGGSPCQGFSAAGKGLAFDDPRSRLFFEFVRSINEIQPRYYLLENVRMKKEHLEVITKHIGVEPVLINSALVSAQNRNRYYWCNWKVEQPEDKGILLKDILEQGVVDRDKSYCIDANYWKGGNLKTYFEKSRRQLVFNKPDFFKIGFERDNRVYSIKGKSPEDIVRKLTPLECERLQTLPDNYTEGVSNTQRYKMLGNGWTVAVIKHILESIPNE